MTDTPYRCCNECLVRSCCTDACDNYVECLREIFGSHLVLINGSKTSKSEERLRLHINMIMKSKKITPPEAKWIKRF